MDEEEKTLFTLLERFPPHGAALAGRLRQEHDDLRRRLDEFGSCLSVATELQDRSAALIEHAPTARRHSPGPWQSLPPVTARPSRAASARSSLTRDGRRPGYSVSTARRPISRSSSRLV